MRPTKDSPLSRRLVLGTVLGLTTVACLAAGGAIARAQEPHLPPARSPFPVVLSGGGTTASSQPAIGDLDLDSGRKSIVFATVTRKLYVMLANGQVATGFPKTLPARADSSPAIGDLDGDGVAEIVIGFGSNSTPTRPGGIRAYRNDGSLLWKRRSKDVFPKDGVRDAVYSTPAIGDVDGDGSVDVAYASFDGHVYVVHGADGTLLPEWPRFVRDTIWSSPALHDLDGDGKLEIIVGVDAHLEGPPFDTPDGGCLHVYRYDGSELNGFPRCVDQVIVSAPAVGDIDGDGKPDIVVGTGTFWKTPERTHALYAFRADGTDVPGWPVAVDGQVSTSPALADLDGDGDLEVIVTSDKTGPSQTFHLDAFHGDGSHVFPSVVPKSFFGTTSSAGTPVVADVLGDDAPEILFPTNTEACVVSATGEQLTDDGSHGSAPTFYTKTSLAGVLVGDLEDDGILEVVAVSGAPFPSAVDTVVHVWNPKGTPTDAPPWGTFRGGAERSATAPGTPVGEGSRYLPLDVYVRRLFVDFLGREPGPGEAQPWIDAIESQAKTRAQVGLEFLESEEYQAGRSTIARCYLGLLNRRPAWTKFESVSADLVAAGCVGLVCDAARRQEIVDDLAALPLFETRFPSALSNEDYVVALYAKVLGRTASQPAIDEWVAGLEHGMTRPEVARHFADSDEYVFDRSPDSVLVLLAYEGFLHKPPRKRVLEDWRIDLALLRPPTDLVQFLITSSAYLARPEP